MLHALGMGCNRISLALAFAFRCLCISRTPSLSASGAHSHSSGGLPCHSSVEDCLAPWLGLLTATRGTGC